MIAAAVTLTTATLFFWWTRNMKTAVTLFRCNENTQKYEDCWWLQAWLNCGHSLRWLSLIYMLHRNNLRVNKLIPWICWETDKIEEAVLCIGVVSDWIESIYG
jgi:hypothetical protein